MLHRAKSDPAKSLYSDMQTFQQSDGYFGKTLLLLPTFRLSATRAEGTLGIFDCLAATNLSSVNSSLRRGKEFKNFAEKSTTVHG